MGMDVAPVMMPDQQMMQGTPAAPTLPNELQQKNILDYTAFPMTRAKHYLVIGHTLSATQRPTDITATPQHPYQRKRKIDTATPRKEDADMKRSKRNDTSLSYTIFSGNASFVSAVVVSSGA